ncbi:MAG: 4Fe-4S binding protein [Eubacteriaceae bacterium]|nr:4Fe-4S binding protein [Eubacteriaceae bacterium]
MNKKNHSLQKSAIRIKAPGGISDRFVAVVCQGCSEPPCAEVCPSNALTPRKGGGVNQDPKKCIGCRRCENACMGHAITYDMEEHKPIICDHCGICANFCPHGCLNMQEVPD